MKLNSVLGISTVLATFQVVNGAPAAAPSNPPLKGSENLLGYASSNVVSNENTDAIKYTLAPGQNGDPKLGQYLDFEKVDNPQPIRGSAGGTDPGPRNYVYDRINSDKLAPPGTDSGGVINAQWPMGLSHAKLGLNGAGWSRQENTVVMPAATAMAGVDMRLEPNGYRELHWHIAGEWALVLNGSCRITAMDENGATFVDDVGKGDVWFFPPGVPHGIQALANGVEFLLVFDQGDFSEDNTFLASEIFLHNPKEVLSKDLSVPVSAFANLPQVGSGGLFIFPGTPAPKDIEAQNVTGTAGIVPRNQSFTYHLSEQPAHEVEGGTVKIVDPSTFPVAEMFSAAIVTVKPGAMREIHWHPNGDEWTFFIEGQGRGTLFTPPASANTFDFRAGDVGYFPKSNSHYVENTGTTDLMFVEVLQADHFSDIALGQWIGSTPKQIVSDTLNLTSATLNKLSTEKKYIVGGNGNSSLST